MTLRNIHDRTLSEKNQNKIFHLTVSQYVEVYTHTPTRSKNWKELIWVMVTHTHTYIKIHQAVYLGSVFKLY